MNKRELIDQIIAKLGAGLETYTRAAQASHAEATDEQNKAENKYDTRGLEAAYLARGQSKQAVETEAAIAAFQKLDARDFGTSEGVDLGAVIELEHQGERSFYFMGPKAGGTEVQHGPHEVLVITPQSPLGERLLGKKKGDRLQLAVDGNKAAHRVISVQ